MLRVLRQLLSLFLLTGTCFAYESKACDFDVLMGKNTKHWQFITQQADISLLSSIKALYERHQAKQFTAEGSYKIPPVVHFIWLGPKQFPPESVENVRTWIARNPEWKFKFWTDRKREPPCNGMEMAHVSDFSFLCLEKCFYDSENWGEKSDILRYEILFQEGGVYVDHDANCLKTFDGMHRGYDFYCGLETPHEPFVGRNITCGNGVIGSRPGHPTIAKVIDLIAHRWEDLKFKFRGKDPYSKIEIVMQRTYIALTDSLAETIDRTENIDIVLPAAYFFSKNGISPLYSQHFYATSWDDFREKRSDTVRTEEKTLNKVKHDSQNIFYYLLILVGFNFFICTLLFFRREKK